MTSKKNVISLQLNVVLGDFCCKSSKQLSWVIKLIGEKGRKTLEKTTADNTYIIFSADGQVCVIKYRFLMQPLQNPLLCSIAIKQQYSKQTSSVKRFIVLENSLDFFYRLYVSPHRCDRKLYCGERVQCIQFSVVFTLLSPLPKSLRKCLPPTCHIATLN